jgi:hypothetical protein
MTRGGDSSGASGSAGPGTTPDERRAAIDRRLDASIGTLNKEVRKEQEKNAQERDARAAANAGNSGSSDSESEGKDADSSGSASTEGPNDKAGGKEKGSGNRPGDLKSEKASKAEGKEGGSSGAAGGSSSGQAGSGAGATEIPDGSDDDVVARRLRKAAEAETDPELKEKLWKEYIEYKKGASK